jgi:bZIP transcription factor
VEDAGNAVTEIFVALAPCLYELYLALLSKLSAHIFPALQRRRAQNREAQKAYRLRKEEKIKELSAKMSEMEREMERMEQLNHDLHTQISTPTENPKAGAFTLHNHTSHFQPAHLLPQVSHCPSSCRPTRSTNLSPESRRGS